MSSARSPRRLPALAGVLLAAALAAGACSSAPDGADSEAVSESDAGGTAADEAAPADGAQAVMDGPGRAASDSEEQPSFVIATGTVSLVGDDVARARFEVQKVVDRAGGQVSEEQTRTGEDGAVATSRMVLRVPSAAFAATMAELEDVAELVESTQASDDVTTQVIDNRVRIRVQRASIRRIEVLLGRAEAIGDVVRIESELSQRQAELNSLLRRQAYLADQTSLSTITVHLERSSEPKAEDDTDDAGFLSGLDAGWGALAAFTVALVTVAGALLPWAAVLLVLGVPLWWLRRTRRRQRPAPAAPAEG